MNELRISVISKNTSKGLLLQQTAKRNTIKSEDICHSKLP